MKNYERDVGEQFIKFLFYMYIIVIILAFIILFYDRCFAFNSLQEVISICL